MSGKIFAAVVAAAVSSASAATVGVVYKKIVEPNHDTAVSASETWVGGAPGRSAVVLNASDNPFGFFVGSTDDSDTLTDPTGESDPGICRGSASCLVVARASDRRVNILGSASPIPPIWLGGDSRDFYADRADQDILSAFNHLAMGRRRLKFRTIGFDPQSDDGSAQSGTPSGSGGQNSSGASGSGGSSPTSSNSGFGNPVEIEVQASSLETFGSAMISVQPSVDDVSSPVDFLTSDSPTDAAPSPTPTIDLSADPPPWQPPGPDIVPVTPVTTPPYDLPTSNGMTTPEPSTWVMMIAGLAALGLFKRRRFAAALKVMRG